MEWIDREVFEIAWIETQELMLELGIGPDEANQEIRKGRVNGRAGGTIPRTCQYCQRRFYVFPGAVSRGAGKYCSNKCKFKDGTKETMLPANIEKRFLSHVEAGPNGCMLWTGCLTSDGYGQFRIGGHSGKTKLAHRWYYEFKKGPIPENYQIDHLCRVRNCVNPSPDHLEAVTQRENILRGTGYSARAARKTHCPQGHPYDLLNTYFSKEGRRICKTCMKVTQKKGIIRRTGERIRNRNESGVDTAVKKIREMYATGEYTQKQLGDIFGYSRGNISGIVRGVLWKGCPGPITINDSLRKQSEIEVLEAGLPVVEAKDDLEPF